MHREQSLHKLPPTPSPPPPPPTPPPQKTKTTNYTYEINSYSFTSQTASNPTTHHSKNKTTNNPHLWNKLTFIFQLHAFFPPMLLCFLHNHNHKKEQVLHLQLHRLREFYHQELCHWPNLPPITISSGRSAGRSHWPLVRQARAERISCVLLLRSSTVSLQHSSNTCCTPVTHATYL